MHRRRLLQYSAIGCALAGLGAWPLPAATTDPGRQARARDWAWLTGSWNVRHRRLRERLLDSHDWEAFGGRSAAWPTLGGLGNLDDNLVELPAGSYRGVSLRAWDAASGTWAIWWLDGRDPGRIDPPVRGRFQGDTGVFSGNDTLRGQPIVMRFTWRAIHGNEPWWEQAFSADQGRSWEVNWRNWFTRTAPLPTILPALADAPRDWDFLHGRWQVRHRRLRDPFSGRDDWETFDGTLTHWPVLGGHAGVADITMHPHAGDEYSVRLHTFEPGPGRWLAWHLDLRQPTRIGAPQRGAAAAGGIRFEGEEQVAARRVRTRTSWWATGPDSARHEQALSLDGGTRWTTWWTSALARVA